MYERNCAAFFVTLISNGTENEEKKLYKINWNQEYDKSEKAKFIVTKNDSIEYFLGKIRL